MLKMMHTGQVDLTITLLFWSHKLYPSVYYENWASFLILIQDIHLGFLGAMIDHIHAHFHHQLPNLLLSHWCEAIDCDIGGGYILLQAWDSCRVVLRGKYEILRIFEMTGLYVQGHQAWTLHNQENKWGNQKYTGCTLSVEGDLKTKAVQGNSPTSTFMSLLWLDKTAGPIQGHQ